MELSTVARRWWPLLAGAALGLLAGGALTALTPTTYAASTVLFLGSPVSTDSAGAYAGDLFSQQRAATYTQLLTSDDLAVKVIDDLSLSMTPAALVAEVSAKQLPKTVLLQVAVSDSQAQRAADIANAYAANFAAYVDRLETPAASNQSNASITVVRKASAPAAPAAPSASLNLGGGLVGGLLLGGAVQWWRRRWDRSIGDAGQLAPAVGADVLGELPADKSRDRCALDLTTESGSRYAEAVRTLRTNLVFVDVDNPPKVVLVASPHRDHATTATAVNLALLFGELGRTAIVVDANLREPDVARYLGLAAGPGLSTVLGGGAAVDEVIVEVPGGNVAVIPAGPVPDDPSELLAGDAMMKVLDAARTSYDLVILDSPATIGYTDAAVLAAQVDGVLLLAVAGRSTAADLATASTALRRVGARLVGTVLTDVR